MLGPMALSGANLTVSTGHHTAIRFVLVVRKGTILMARPVACGASGRHVAGRLLLKFVYRHSHLEILRTVHLGGKAGKELCLGLQRTGFAEEELNLWAQALESCFEGLTLGQDLLRQVEAL